MAEIDVRKTGEDDHGFAFEVTVREAGDVRRHDVTLSREDFRELGTGSESPEGFVGDCFRFLLDRASNEEILDRIDVREIGRYYPRFEEEFVRPRRAR